MVQSDSETITMITNKGIPNHPKIGPEILLILPSIHNSPGDYYKSLIMTNEQTFYIYDCI